MSEQPPTEYALPGWFPDPTGLQAQRWWDGTQWSQQTRPLPGIEQEPQLPYQPQQSYGQPRPARKSWSRRYKILSVLGGLAALIIVIAGTASASGNAKQTDNASAISITTPTGTATPRQAPTHHARRPETRPKKALVTAQATSPAPAATAPIAAPPPPPATIRSGCHPQSGEDTCYRPGEHCRWSHHWMSGVAGDGKEIRCGNHDSWRWETADGVDIRYSNRSVGT